MDILIVGGTPAHRGGVEQFCDRAAAALKMAGGRRVAHIYTYGAYLRIRSIPRLLGCIGHLVRKRREGFGRVWLQYVSLPDLVILVACRVLGYELLVTPHLGSNWSSQANPVLRRITRKALGLSSAIGLISPTQAEEISLPSSPPRFDLLTFLPQKFPSRPAVNERGQGRLSLVHAGRLSEGKGTFLFLEVCAILHRANYDYDAQLIGSCDGVTLQQLQSFIAENALDEVVLVGPVLEAEMLRRLSLADVLVHLSRIDSFPLIVLESIGCGVYPICKDLPGARRMVETYAGHVVQGGNAVNDVAAFLLGRSPEDLRACAEPASKRLAQDYHWDKCVAAVERAFAGIASRR